MYLIFYLMCPMSFVFALVGCLVVRDCSVRDYYPRRQSLPRTEQCRHSEGGVQRLADAEAGLRASPRHALSRPNLREDVRVLAKWAWRATLFWVLAQVLRGLLHRDRAIISQANRAIISEGSSCSAEEALAAHQFAQQSQPSTNGYSFYAHSGNPSGAKGGTIE